MRMRMQTMPTHQHQPKPTNKYIPASEHAQDSQKNIWPSQTCFCEGGCPRCAPIQAKLQISPPHDRYEDEADHLADQVMRMPEADSKPTPSLAGNPVVQRKCESCEKPDNDEETPIQRKCESCEKPDEDEETPVQRKCESCEQKEDDEKPIQRKGQAGGAPTTAGPTALPSLQSQGVPLPKAARNFFEPRFQRDFSQVRIHTHGTAVQTADAIHAHAFTQGQNIAFNSGQYHPETGSGKRLLAHELAHTIQQAQGKITAIQRSANWEDPAPGECDDVPQDAWLEKVVVEQEKPQSVTLYWSDGTLESDECSTGKGHCCVDSANPNGVACTVEQSQLDNTNCTPITRQNGFTIKKRFLSHNGWAHWCEFETNRHIALHYYPSADGYPRSHGCVRLHPNTARHIFCGARQEGDEHQTYVQVRGFSRPLCSDPSTQEEWQGDFDTASKNLEDYSSDPDYQTTIREARKMLRRAIRSDLTVPEMGALTIADVPRCAGVGLPPTTEEARLYSPTQPTGTVPAQLLVSSGLEALLLPFLGDLRTASSLTQARTRVRNRGRELWQTAETLVQGTNSDDRSLYWARLQMTRAIRQWSPSFTLSAANREDLIARFDRASRGLESVNFSGAAGVKKILISGFDPFSLDVDIRHGNPSGAAALALDNQPVTSGSIQGEIQGVVFPVSFEAMDTGMVESFFQPYMTGENAVDMIVALGMGSNNFFEVEEFAGPPHPGAQNLAATETPPQFHKTSLPTTAMRGALGRTAPLPEETQVTEIPLGGSGPVPSPSGPTPGSQAVEGTAGTYLCNEIFYRLTLLRDTVNHDLPVGFIHTPMLNLPAGSANTSSAYETQRNDIITKVKELLQAALPHI